MSQRQRGAFMPDESGLRIGDVGDEGGKTFAGLSLRDGGDAGFVHAKRQTDTGQVELFRPFLLLLGGRETRNGIRPPMPAPATLPRRA